MKIILATKNEAKIREINRIFSDLDVEFIGMDNYPGIPKVIEDGKTYHENALKKAKAVYQDTKMPVVSEDSGLEVDALNSDPGIFSARFSGSNASDEENITKLMHLIKNIPEEKRTAQFISVFCLIHNQKVRYFAGEVKGKIITESRGNSGFGYDPVFIPEGYNKTYAELGEDIKNRISHRANAMKKLKKYLLENAI